MSIWKSAKIINKILLNFTKNDSPTHYIICTRNRYVTRGSIDEFWYRYKDNNRCRHRISSFSSEPKGVRTVPSAICSSSCIRLDSVCL